jgi:Flp pilus assembly CpaF family ATPase
MGCRTPANVAHLVGAEVHPGNPRVSAELRETKERFKGLFPPIVTAAAFVGLIVMPAPCLMGC